MKQMKLTVVAVACAMIFVASGCKKSAGGSLVLSDLGEALRVAQGNADLDVVTGKISYKRINMVKYDDISKRSAEIYAMVQQFEHLLKLKEEKKLPEGFDIAAIIAFGAVAMPEAVKNVATLIERAGQLNPKNDFTGVDATKVPKAVALITESVNRLKESGEKGAELVKKLTGKDCDKPAEGEAPAEEAPADETPAEG